MTEIKLSERRIIQQKGRQQSTPTHKKNLWLMWSKTRNNNRTQSEQWITNISIRRNQNCTKAKTTNKRYIILTAKVFLRKKHSEPYNCTSKTVTNTHNTHTNTIGQHFGNVIMKVMQKTITEPESIKLSKTLHDHDLVEQAYSHSWEPDCYT